mgnify:CR=1 FL=1
MQIHGSFFFFADRDEDNATDTTPETLVVRKQRRENAQIMSRYVIWKNLLLKDLRIYLYGQALQYSFWVDQKDGFNHKEGMDFIDDPIIGHTKFRLPMLLVPVIMFAVVILGIAASKLFIASVVDHSPTANHWGTGEDEWRPYCCFQDPRRPQVGTWRILVVFLRSFRETTFLRRISQGYWFFPRKSRDYRNSQHCPVQLQAFLARCPLRWVAFKPLIRI